MNIREGMRRVGIVLGVLGSVAGAALGYWGLEKAWSTHTKLGRLQALPIMREVNEAIGNWSIKNQGKTTASADSSPVKPPKTTSATDFETPGEFMRSKRAEKERASQHHLTPDEFMRSQNADIELTPDKFMGHSGFSIEEPGGIESWAVTGPDDSIKEIWVDVKGNEGIQTVRADKTGTISSVQLATGEWVSRGSGTLKARLAFVASLLLPFCYPVIGFLVPWGTTKALVWVGIGFVAPRSSA